MITTSTCAQSFQPLYWLAVAQHTFTDSTCFIEISFAMKNCVFSVNTKLRKEWRNPNRQATPSKTKPSSSEECVMCTVGSGRYNSLWIACAKPNNKRRGWRPITAPSLWSSSVKISNSISTVQRPSLHRQYDEIHYWRIWLESVAWSSVLPRLGTMWFSLFDKFHAHCVA